MILLLHSRTVQIQCTIITIFFPSRGSPIRLTLIFDNIFFSQRIRIPPRAPPAPTKSTCWRAASVSECSCCRTYAVSCSTKWPVAAKTRWCWSTAAIATATTATATADRLHRRPPRSWTTGCPRRWWRRRRRPNRNRIITTITGPSRRRPWPTNVRRTTAGGHRRPARPNGLPTGTTVTTTAAAAVPRTRNRPRPSREGWNRDPNRPRTCTRDTKSLTVRCRPAWTPNPTPPIQVPMNYNIIYYVKINFYFHYTIINLVHYICTTVIL